MRTKNRSYCRHEWVERRPGDDPHGVVPLSHGCRGAKPARTRIFECLKCGWVKSKYIYSRPMNKDKAVVSARMARVRWFREAFSGTDGEREVEK